MNLYDAHSHLQDERLHPWLPEVLGMLPRAGVHRVVVAGSCEEDWAAVASLARAHEWVKPSFGLHPWYVKERSPRWKDSLLGWLDEFPGAAIGEIGLDRWIQNPDIADQLEAFRWQLGIAAEQNRPAAIHCLKAWGLLDETLRSVALPRCGFLLHSYGGPSEMVPQFAHLGAYFSFSPGFCQERKARQALTFAVVPDDRLLAETDAPDMCPPDSLNPHPLWAADGRPLNHPANLIVSYRKLAELRGASLEEIVTQIEQNFIRLFGPSD
ncbi:MAG: TatD family hydrolase [Verrucomicrobiaceae bacterium]|nr:TatD family hydrolase [Verrucomicrobiaceae bacterium]